MKKYLKFLLIFAFLFTKMQVFGQARENDYDWDWMEGRGGLQSHLPVKRMIFNPNDNGNGTGWDHGSQPPPPPPPPPQNVYKFMTFNLCHFSSNKNKYKDIISCSGADVVLIQEQKGIKKFSELKQALVMDGTFSYRNFQLGSHEGVAILWERSRVGSPSSITHFEVDNPSEPNNPNRVIICEFSAFCAVCTHYHSNFNTLSETILNHSVVQSCISKGKPVYIGADFNVNPDNNAIQIFKNEGFRVLNDVSKNSNGNYNYPTSPSGMVKDMILEHNNNQGRNIVLRGIRCFPDSYWGTTYLKKIITICIGDEPIIIQKWVLVPTSTAVSDHRPYYVEVKIK